MGKVTKIASAEDRQMAIKTIEFWNENNVNPHNLFNIMPFLVAQALANAYEDNTDLEWASENLDELKKTVLKILRVAGWE